MRRRILAALTLGCGLASAVSADVAAIVKEAGRHWDAITSN